MPRLVPPVVEPGTLAATPQPMIAVDEELCLRPFEVLDAGAVVIAFADPDIRYWHLRRIDGLEEARGWVAGTHRAWAAEQAATWAVATPEGEVWGRVTLHLRLAEGHGEVSYWVLPGARGGGVATRAVRALTGWGHLELGLRRIELRHSVRNRPSCRVAVRSGYRPEGTLRSALLHEDGWHDVHLHAHIAGDAVPSAPSARPRGVRRPGGS